MKRRRRRLMMIRSLLCFRFCSLPPFRRSALEKQVTHRTLLPGNPPLGCSCFHKSRRVRRLNRLHGRRGNRWNRCIRTGEPEGMPVPRIVETDRSCEDPTDHRPVRFEEDGADMTRKGQNEQDKGDIVQPGRPEDKCMGEVRGVDILVRLDQTREDDERR